MKKTNLILFILLVIAVTVVVIIFFKQKSEPEKVLRDFAVQDTAAIDKIFMADKSNKTILLERKSNYWTVNGKFTARRDLVDLLLETICKLEVNSPVPEAKLDKVLKDLSVTGIKTEIYQHGELTKTYYVGGVTPDNMGTYMIMEGSELPFIVYIPGFNGYLTVRYNTEINEWREKNAFNYKIQDIAKVSVKYGDNKDESFIVEALGKNGYCLKDIDGNDIAFEYDPLILNEFVARCKYIGFEAYIMDELQQSKRDSLSKEPMIVQYTIENKSGETRTLKTYFRQNINKLLDDNGVPYEYDIDRLYGIIDDKEVVLMQFYVLDPISLTKSEFMVKN
ncbi:MAG TPA: DUF4340 domain-containing protein [Bacteroidales bacterium]|nr:DUF4340 domain-containing protein [Bacteroidales bacterium]